MTIHEFSIQEFKTPTKPSDRITITEALRVHRMPRREEFAKYITPCLQWNDCDYRSPFESMLFVLTPQIGTYPLHYLTLGSKDLWYQQRNSKSARLLPAGHVELTDK